MISDVLSDAVHDMDRYLNDPLYDDPYGSALRARILAVRGQLETLRRELDNSPGDERTEREGN